MTNITLLGGLLALICLHTASASRWSAVPMAPADPILGVGAAFKADPSAADQKVNLGIGAYRDNQVTIPCCRATSTYSMPEHQPPDCPG